MHMSISHFVYPLTNNGHLHCFQLGWYIKLLETFAYRSLYRYMFSFLLGKYLEVGLLGCTRAKFIKQI